MPYVPKRPHDKFMGFIACACTLTGTAGGTILGRLLVAWFNR